MTADGHRDGRRRLRDDAGDRAGVSRRRWSPAARPRTRSSCARARRRRTVSAVLRPQLPLIESAAAGGARRRRPAAGVARAGRRSSRCRGMTDNQPANVPVRGVGPRAFDVRDTLTVRRRAPLHAGHARDQRRPAGGRPLQGADARQRRQVRQRDLEGRRRLHGRRRVVRVGSVGRRRPDDAGVSAQRLSVGDRRSWPIRRRSSRSRRRSPPIRASICSRSASRTTTTEQSRRRPTRDPRVRHVRHR